MFAVVRTGGKQYRVAAGDKIAVEKIPGEAGDSITIDDVLLASDGGEAKDGITVSAEIIAQAKGEKVIVFKKRRRHNYRRKAGHRQQYTILKITAIGDAQAEKKPAKAKAPKPAEEDVVPAADEALVAAEAPLKVEGDAGIPTEAAVEAPKKKSTRKPKADTGETEGTEA